MANYYYRKSGYSLGDQFVNMYESSYDLLSRFGIPINIYRATLKLQEEVQEFFEAVEKQDLDNAVLEACDVITSLISTLYNLNITEDELIGAMRSTYLKNDAKTWETHTVINGMIVRQEK